MDNWLATVPIQTTTTIIPASTTTTTILPASTTTVPAPAAAVPATASAAAVPAEASLSRKLPASSSLQAPARGPASEAVCPAQLLLLSLLLLQQVSHPRPRLRASDHLSLISASPEAPLSALLRLPTTSGRARASWSPGSLAAGTLSSTRPGSTASPWGWSQSPWTPTTSRTSSTG